MEAYSQARSRHQTLQLLALFDKQLCNAEEFRTSHHISKAAYQKWQSR